MHQLNLKQFAEHYISRIVAVIYCHYSQYTGLRSYRISSKIDNNARRNTQFMWI